MKPHKQLCLAFVMSAVLICLSVRAAVGDLVLQFSIDGGNNFGTSFDVVTGQSLSVGVYLRDTNMGGTLETKGLFGFGMTATAVPASLGTVSSAAINPVFDLETTEEFTALTIDWEAAVFLTAIPTGQSIRLGDFQYDTTADGSTVFSVGDRQPGIGSTNINWLDGAGSELDQLIFGVGASNVYDLTINATAVPESSSFVLLGVVFSAFATCRLRVFYSSWQGHPIRNAFRKG